MNYQERLTRVIPGGAHTYSRGVDQHPSNAPALLERGQGAYVWDPDGLQYLDYGMALRSVTLGYAHPAINAAAYRQIELGNNLTRPSRIELEAAELLVDVIHSAEMVKFAKNGSNATTAAVKIARAFTGRRYVCIPRQQPFFSFDDWFIGVTPVQRGVLPEAAAATLRFDYGDVASLQSCFDAHPGEIAAVMMEPATTLTPCAAACDAEETLDADGRCATGVATDDNFLQAAERLCRKHDALLVLDEMITGFRWHLRGAQHYFGVTPDLCTFGKGMANGFSVAAIAGRREIMSVGAIEPVGMERTFLLSTTHGGEMCGLGAFVAAVAEYQRADVCRHLWQYGASLRSVLRSAAADAGMQTNFTIEGPAISLNYVVRDAAGAASLPMRTLFAQEMVRRGVLMPWIAVSLAHGDSELQKTAEAARGALAVCRLALEDGIERYLEGPAVRPVFRRHN